MALYVFACTRKSNDQMKTKAKYDCPALTGHAVHATPSLAALYPLRHWHEVSAGLASAESVLAGHDEHAAAPIVSLYVDLGQAEQLLLPV